jgi:DNA uptake protein ComE-like DNA-binding protein/endonuclease YncB( thermonuclease family)
LFFTGLRAEAADSYAALRQTTDAVIIEVSDTDGFIAEIPGGLALVRLAGVDAADYKPGFEYAVKELTGAAVTIVPENSVESEGRWNAAYVYRAGRLINEALLAGGFARLNNGDRKAGLFTRLAGAESAARLSRAGLWNEGTYVYAGPKVNINTASAAQLMNAFGLSSLTIPNAAVAYRERHPFETVSELKYVPGVTKAVYDAARANLTVSTNFLTAPYEELITLKNVSGSAAQSVIDARGRLTEVSQLKGLLSAGVYADNEAFLSNKDVTKINAAAPNYTVNVNAASAAQLEAAGLTPGQARSVIAWRSNYTLKSLYDFMGSGGFGFSDLAISYLADNLHVHTDVNTATEYELNSLFGGAADSAVVAAIIQNRPYTAPGAVAAFIPEAAYARIAPHITPAREAVNINTATIAQLRGAGLSDAVAGAVYYRRGQMRIPADIPPGVPPDGFSLHTNVNTATAAELESLGVPHQEIIAFRADQPIGGYAELSGILSRLGIYAAGLSRFAVVR